MGEEPTQLPAPPPPPPPKPFYRVVTVRPNGTEQTRKEFPWTVGDLANEQAARLLARDEARLGVDAGEHIRIYSSHDDGSLDKAKDLGWDSTVNPH